MIQDEILARYLSSLVDGDRQSCRRVVEETLQKGVPAHGIYVDLIWPIAATIEKLLRQDRITHIQEHLATRINRTIVDQLQNKLPRNAPRCKKVAICCAETELQELGAQMTADLFESDGWEVRFLGGGLTNDDLFSFVNDYGPDLLVLYGTTPRQAPQVRLLIDTLRTVNAWPNMKIMVSGGLFNRAEGLWEEIGADIFAATPAQALQVASDGQPSAYVAQRTINRRKKKKPVIVAATPKPHKKVRLSTVSFAR
ncbi:MAG: cobalamin-dependent protein [Phycisphaerae bacterium]|nr:cobalamin-dependent protein [Phycisphaerae bacterium]